MSERGVHVAATTDELMFAGRGPRPDADVSWRWFPGWWPILDRELDLRRVRWDGADVVERSRAELDDIDESAIDAGETRYVEDVRVRAFVSVLIDELNILRQQHGLAPRTPAQALSAIKVKLQETRQLRER